MPKKDTVPFVEVDTSSLRVYGGRVHVTFNVYHARLGRKVLKGVSEVNLKNLGVINVKILGKAQQYQLIVVGDTERCDKVLELIDATVREDTAQRKRLLDALR